MHLKVNTKLIESLVQIIHSLSEEEQALLEEKLFFDPAYPASSEIRNIALHSNSFDFLAEEPDLYTLEDGEPIS